MDRIRAGDLAGRDDLVDVEVGFARRRRTDADALVGEAHVHCIRVGGGVHSDRLDAELLAGPQDAKRNFTAVGDQDFLEHRPAYSMTTSGSPYSTGCASWHRIAVTVPARGA